jgi:hypothetical protein
MGGLGGSYSLQNTESFKASLDQALRGGGAGFRGIAPTFQNGGAGNSATPSFSATGDGGGVSWWLIAAAGAVLLFAFLRHRK